ncbi:hypothetical protein ABH942_002210 [Flavobacterium sp. 28YEA47A]|uniref:T9SS type A sorting domain-containing protein n=1 Tax=Flavobacterium sp. 28YEA47A TaxID=3156276 RepID=UPI003519C597
MEKKIIFQLLFFLFTITAFSQQYFPGGVAGAEAWYIVHHEQLDAQIFQNHSNAEIKILQCQPYGNNKGFFNFNPSIDAEQLCLSYNTALEITTARNIFFVGEPKENGTNFSHLTVNWNELLANLPQTDSLVKNRFDLAATNTYFNKRLVPYEPTNPASISFYHWNMYQSDKKFKSYGKEGESTFFIGKSFTNELTDALHYAGSFPEFISFPFELSANERSRVESYLALKYGLTLEMSKPYRNSKNLVYWSEKNLKFSNRIFGIGRDDISALNQLQSESSHNKDYLVVAVSPIRENNVIKQETVSIPNNHFIVFGDNGTPDTLLEVNAHDVRVLRRKWLAQSTGTTTSEFPMFLKLKLPKAMIVPLKNDQSLRVWMLHDKFAKNTQVSSFTSQYVDYYDTSTDLTGNYIHVSRFNFDKDKSIYDQFTFGIGPKMIVQVRFDPNCDNDKLKAVAVITGGNAPFEVTVSNTNGYVQGFGVQGQTLSFNVNAPDTYTVRVVDSSGYERQISVPVVSPQMNLDLGPDQVLSANLQQITLNAGQNVSDPQATYKWYRNNVLLEYYGATLTVDKPGEYTVKVLSGNHMCEKTDTILISYQFSGTATQIVDCQNPSGVISLHLNGGIAPFTTVITGSGQTVYQVHNTENFVFSDIDFGLRTITTTDINGEVFTTTVMVQDLGGMQLNLTAQLQQNCTDYGYNYSSSYRTFSCENIILDAGALVTNPNVSYEWFMNGNSMNIYSSTVQTVIDEVAFPLNASGYNEFQVKIKNLQTGCEVTEFFGMTKYGGIISTDTSFTTRVKDDVKAEPEKDPKFINAKVYPNPSESGATFYYEVTSSEVFSGTIEIFSPTGAILHKQSISGKSTYTVPFSLSTAGMYLIYTKTNNGTQLTDKIIIK